MSARFAVIGDPVGHSLSPKLFERLFATLKIDATYVAKKVRPEEVSAVVDAMRHGEWDGLSVTVPHKLAVRELADTEDSLVTRIGAANTLVRKGDRVSAYNTDAEGCRRALSHAGVSLEGSRVLILGAGGAARAAVFAALDADARDVIIANRTLVRAKDLAGHTRDSRCSAIPLESASLREALADTNILIQSTTQGMMLAGDSALPADVELPAYMTVLDMVYRPLHTALLRKAAYAQCQIVDGLWMLVFQALRQFELWTGAPAPESAAVSLHTYLREEALI